MAKMKTATARIVFRRRESYALLHVQETLFPLLHRCVRHGRHSATDNRAVSKAERIDELVARYAKHGYLNGTVLVAEHGKIIYEKGIGEANMESHVPNTPRTKFGIASLTKQFTAALVLQRAAEGRIRLDDKVSDYLPWYRKDTGSA